MDQDILSDVLQSVRLSGAIIFEVEVASPWAAAAPVSSTIAASVIPDAQHVIEYHVLIEGSCWARITGHDGEPPILLSPGSIVAFPQGDAHILASNPDLDAEPDLDNFDQAARAKTLPVHLNYAKGRLRNARLICGFLGCDVTPFNPLIESLPRMVHIPDGYDSGNGFLGQLIRAAVGESQTKGEGSRGVLSKLSELIFIELVRRHLSGLKENAGGWLGGLRDPGIGRAIRLLHARPDRRWTLAELAREAGLSRTVLAERFNNLIGIPPMTYLTSWRMQRAAAMFSMAHMPLSQIAADLGYDSEAAFSRAFKRNTGLSPAQWRKTRVDGVPPTS